jgi:DNA-binding MarR family transcriptional regulator
VTAEVASRTRDARRETPRPTWSFLTNHPVVLIYITQHPESTVRAIAVDVGLTERATLAILRDLDDERLVERHRQGRRNTYVVRYERLVGMVGAGTPANAAVEAVVRALISISPEGRAASRKRKAPSVEDRGPRMGTWAFFTNHMALLVAIARAPTLTVRELAVLTRLTERGALTILNQLEAESIVLRHREGRRNRYTIDLDAFSEFRGWSYATWSIPEQLIDVARKGIRAIGRA